jgi:hypothetical protein
MHTLRVTLDERPPSWFAGSGRRDYRAHVLGDP